VVEINLLPDEMKKKKRSAPRIDVSAVALPKIPFMNMAIMAFGALLAVQVALFLIGVVSGATFKNLEAKYKVILPEKVETEKLRSQVDRTNKKVSAIDELMVKRFSWAKKLNSLSDCLTPGIWLTELEYDEKLSSAPKAANADSAKKKSFQAADSVVSRYLILSGAASSMGEDGTALIGRFIKSLKDDPEFYSDFKDIELGTIRREKMEDQEVMTFKITCFFKAR